MLAVEKPEMHIPQAEAKFDADGRLVDERARQQVRGLLAALASSVRRLRGE